ncbi:hypothetical protein [Streptomyces sp. NPDC058861]|uniref:RapZ C-terminal domain-containing protein n=1 Tax=Streptomyces sp. NPDC058861 TaxID=3346653 RepID=UPI0036868F89
MRPHTFPGEAWLPPPSPRSASGTTGVHALVTDGLYLDLRHALRNPADDPTMCFRTGLDDDVHAHVLKTPGTLTPIHRTAVQLRALADEVPAGRLVRLTVTCQGGRHRAVDRTCDRVSAE